MINTIIRNELLLHMTFSSRFSRFLWDFYILHGSTNCPFLFIWHIFSIYLNVSGELIQYHNDMYLL